MPKGFTNKPIKVRARSARISHIGIYAATYRLPGQSGVKYTLDPADYPERKAFMDVLGPLWMTRSRELPGSVHAIHYALKEFLTFLGTQGVTTWEQVTPDLLREFESNQQQQHTQNVARRNLDQVWALLRTVPDRLLSAPTRLFLSHQPIVPPGVTKPTEGMPEATLKQVLRAAMKLVATAEHRIGNAQPESPERFIRLDETLAFYILLLFELSWSMDVLKYLTFDAGGIVTITDWGEPDPDDPKQILGGEVTAAWLKKRGSAADTYTSLCDSPWRGGTILRRLRDATKPTRDAIKNDSDLDAQSAWLCYRESDGMAGRKSKRASQAVARGQIVRVFDLRDSLFREWLARQQITVMTDDYTSALSYRSIKPAAKAFRHVQVSRETGLMAIDLVDEHTLDVYSSRYMRSEIIMRELADTFFVNIAGVAEDVARTFKPTIVTPDGTVIGAAMDDETVEEVLNGDKEIGLTACRDPRKSPFPGEQEGSLCGVAFRACFFCPNAVVTPRHATRMERVKEVAEQQQTAMSPPEWQAKFGETVAFIDVALPRLQPYAASTQQLPADIVDLGVIGVPEW